MSYLIRDAERIRACVPAGTEMPDDSDDLFLLYAVLLRVKGTAVTERDVHEAWVAWMELRGQQHDSMRPFQELTADVRAEDTPFVLAIRRASAETSSATL